MKISGGIRSGSKVGRTIGFVAAVLLLLILLFAALAYTFAYRAMHDYRRGITEQIAELNSGKEDQEPLKLQKIPLGGLINPGYQKTHEAEGEYQSLYLAYAEYLGQQRQYEADVATYNQKVAAGEETDGGKSLSERAQALNSALDQLTARVNELQSKLNSF